MCNQADRCRFLTCCAGGLLLLLRAITGCPAAESGQDARRAEHFEREVRPLLADRCWDCHGPGEQEGGLRLDTVAGLHFGGDSGPPVVAGEPDKSLLITAVRYGAGLEMPPDGKLSQQEIDVLVEWVDQGAYWPASSTVTENRAERPQGTRFTAAQKAHWSFQPVSDPQPPAVERMEWSQTPVDRFVLAKLEANGLTPAPPSDKQTLIRRLTFDLIGLPPTRAEMKTFLEDSSPDAYVRLVDRLLSSPHYGERWGRRWLDLVRYADTTANDGNFVMRYAYRFRDYVVDAFNRDLPYDEFVVEQLAGDLILQVDDVQLKTRRQVATGFLMLGPKSLAEADKEQVKMDIVDEQIDVTGRTFLGLTIACARCHDHKFDPVPTTDYYALAGIFRSTEVLLGPRPGGITSMWHENSVDQFGAAEKEAYLELSQEVERLDSRIKRRREEMVAAQRDWEKELVRVSQNLEPLPADPLLYVPLDELVGVAVAAADGDQPVGEVLGKPRWDAGKFGGALNFDGGTCIRLGDQANFSRTDKFSVSAWIFPTAEGPFAVVCRMDTGFSQRGWDLYFEEGRLFCHLAHELEDNWIRVGTPDRLALHQWHHVMATYDGSVQAAGVKLYLSGILQSAVTEADTLTKGIKNGVPLAIGRRSPGRPFRGWIDDVRIYQRELTADEVRRVANEDPILRLATVPSEQRSTKAEGSLQHHFLLHQDALGEQLLAERVKVNQQQSDLEDTNPAIMVMMPREGKAQNLRVHLRGNRFTLGAEAPRRFLQIIAGEDQAPLKTEGSGRLELARWISSADHPLTARVMVNRIWQACFGRGLVATSDNFGRLGDEPTHPGLLDWLAARFVESGWSIKVIHRLLVLSSVYQMQSVSAQPLPEIDSDNRLMWRQNRRRLEAELLRDAMLLVTGDLDRAVGGQDFDLTGGAVATDADLGLFSASSFNFDFEGYLQPRRSLYLPVIRNAIPEMLALFDAADANAVTTKRNESTVAPQMLFMINSPFVREQSLKFSRRLLNDGNLTDEDRLQRAYEMTLARPPSQEELDRAMAYLTRYGSVGRQLGWTDDQIRQHAWHSYCQVLFCLNEFVYVE